MRVDTSLGFGLLLVAAAPRVGLRPAKRPLIYRFIFNHSFIQFRNSPLPLLPRILIFSRGIPCWVRFPVRLGVSLDIFGLGVIFEKRFYIISCRIEMEVN